MPQSARIMIVDDARFVRMVLKELLEKKRSHKIVAEASNGEEAVSLYLEHSPDLVLMDLNMPGVGGNEATKRIIQMNPEARIIALSGIDNREGILQALAAGAVDFLAKPVDPNLLLTIIDHHIAAERKQEGYELEASQSAVSMAFSFLSELLRHSISPLNEQLRRVIKDVVTEFALEKSSEYEVDIEIPTATPRSELPPEKIKHDLQDLFSNLQHKLEEILPHELAADLLQETYQTFHSKHKRRMKEQDTFFPKTIWLMGGMKRLILNLEATPTPDLTIPTRLDPSMIWFAVYKLGTTGSEVVSAQEGDIQVKNSLDLLSWHLKAGLVFLTALGQGSEYHIGLFGPFPVPASKEHSALVYATILPDAQADDPRMPGRSYTVVGLFYPRTLEILFPERDFISDVLAKFLDNIKDASELDNEKLDMLRNRIFS